MRHGKLGCQALLARGGQGRGRPVSVLQQRGHMEGHERFHHLLPRGPRRHFCPPGQDVEQHSYQRLGGDGGVDVVSDLARSHAFPQEVFRREGHEVDHVPSDWGVEDLRMKHDPREVGVLDDEVDHDLHVTPQGVREGLSPFFREDSQGATELTDADDEDFTQEAVLVLEVEVEGADGDGCSASDVDGASARHALRGEHARAVIEEALVGLHLAAFAGGESGSF